MLLVAKEDPGRIVDDELLGLMVERLALLLVRDLLRLVEQSSTSGFSYQQYSRALCWHWQKSV